MASETVHDADAAIAATLQRGILAEARAAVVMQPTFLIDELGEDEPTLAKKYPKSPTLSDASDLSDGTAEGNTQIQPTSVTATAAGVGIAADVTRQSAKGSILDVAAAITILSRAIVNKFEADAAAMIAAFSTVTGSSGVDLSIGNWITALFNVENANEDQNVVSVLHPVQIQDLRTAVTSAGGAVFGNPNESGVTGLLGSAQSKGFKGSFLGVPIYGSTEVDTAGGDRDGAMYAAQRALVWLWRWRLMVETDPQIKLPGMSVALTCAYGLGELFDGAGTTISTDA